IAFLCVRTRWRFGECPDRVERTRAAVSSRPAVEHQACTSRAGRTSSRGDLLLGALEHQAQDEKSRGGMGPATCDPDRDTGGARARDEASQAAGAFASAKTAGGARH